MVTLVFDESYGKFVTWRARHFQYLPVNGSLQYAYEGNLEYFISIERNCFYIANKPLTEKEKNFVLAYKMIEIKLVL